jgi:hypothetical protein
MKKMGICGCGPKKISWFCAQIDIPYAQTETPPKPIEKLEETSDFLISKRISKIESARHPNEEDLENAKTFANDLKNEWRMVARTKN